MSEQNQKIDQNIPVTRVLVNGNSVVPLLRAFASKGYSNGAFSLAESAKLNEVFEYLDNLQVLQQQQQSITKEVSKELERVKEVEEESDDEISTDHSKNTDSVDATRG